MNWGSLLKILGPLLGGAAAGLTGSAIAGLAGGSGGQQAGRNPDGSIAAQSLNPIWPWMQPTFGDWLFSGFTQKEDGGWDLKGADPYTGALTPDVSKTRLPEAWGNWQPWDGGMMHMADIMANNKLGVGQFSPLTQQMMQWGGTGGPGNYAMSNMMQFGTPSEAGRGLANMAQFGAPSAATAAPLQAMAQGQLPPAAALLLPFLSQPGRRR